MIQTYSASPSGAHVKYSWSNDYMEEELRYAFGHSIYDTDSGGSVYLIQMPALSGVDGSKVTSVKIVVDTNVPSEDYNGSTWTANIGIGFVNSQTKPSSYKYSTITYLCDLGYTGRQTLTFNTSVDINLNQTWYFSFCYSSNAENAYCSFDYGTPVSVVLTCELPDKTVQYCINGQLIDCIPYYCHNGSWQKCEPYYCTKEGWKLCSTT